jgi:hypothetical protein
MFIYANFASSAPTKTATSDIRVVFIVSSPDEDAEDRHANRRRKGSMFTRAARL